MHMWADRTEGSLFRYLLWGAPGWQRLDRLTKIAAIIHTSWHPVT